MESLMRSRRRCFFWVIFLGLLTAGSLSWGACKETTEKQEGQLPNILFAISDDQSWLHNGASGDPVVKTPIFDRVAREGILFTHAFCSAPSCTPSRGSILSGRHFSQLEEGANLWGPLPKNIQVYPEVLEEAGYHVGYTGKGWAPGLFEASGRHRNPAGPYYESFDRFLKSIPNDEPFCFWFGSHDPHRPYDKGSGLRSGMKLDDVQVPPFWPDQAEIRGDILDYYFEVERFDHDVGRILHMLEAAGKLDNTIFVITSDNGMPFPRAKGNLYDYGTRMPLAIRWAAKAKAGRVIEDFISFADFAPTFIQGAGLEPSPAMTGRSFLDLLTAEKAGRVDPSRNRVFIGRERHSSARVGELGYPARAIRTFELLYIHNLFPDRWPAGDPEPYRDIDDSPTKTFLIQNRDSEQVSELFQLAFGKRPAEELYDLVKDPAQMNNVADLPEYSVVKRQLREELDRWSKEIGDPRAVGQGQGWDTQPYPGRPSQTFDPSPPRNN